MTARIYTARIYTSRLLCVFIEIFLFKNRKIYLFFYLSFKFIKFRVRDKILHRKTGKPVFHTTVQRPLQGVLHKTVHKVVKTLLPKAVNNIVKAVFLKAVYKILKYVSIRDNTEL